MKIYSGGNRIFEIWAYTSSHSTLLIRSNIDESMGIMERIDFACFGVKFVSLPALFTVNVISDSGEGRIRFMKDDTEIGYIETHLFKIKFDNEDFFRPSGIEIDWGVLRGLIE